MSQRALKVNTAGGMIFMNFFKEKMQWAGKQAENKTFVMAAHQMCSTFPPKKVESRSTLLYFQVGACPFFRV